MKCKILIQDIITDPAVGMACAIKFLNGLDSKFWKRARIINILSPWYWSYVFDYFKSKYLFIYLFISLSTIEGDEYIYFNSNGCTKSSLSTFIPAIIQNKILWWLN